MAIQLSGYLWLRNTKLMSLINSKNKKISNEDRSKLKKIVDEIDSLHEPLSDTYRNPKPIIGKHILLPKGVTKIIERSSNRKKSGQLFTQIHSVLKKYNFSESMFKDMYCSFGRAFSEIGLTPNKEIKKAITYAENLKTKGYKSGDGSFPVFWNEVLKSK